MSSPETKNTTTIPGCRGAASCSALRAKLWAMHELAELEMLTVAREKPRRPWYRKRAARVIKAYEETLDAVPMPPD